MVEFKTMFLAMAVLVVGGVYFYVTYLSNGGGGGSDKTIYTNNEGFNEIKAIEDYLNENKKKDVITVGKNNNIICDAFDEVTGNKSSQNHIFETKNASICVGCYDKITNTVVEFRDKKHYEYDPKEGGSLMDFYTQIFHSNLKANFFERIGTTYIVVPELITNCYFLGGDDCECDNPNDTIVKLRARDYIRETLAGGLKEEVRIK